MDTYKIKKENCPNCWGHQEYANKRKPASDFSRKWQQKYQRTIGWIQHLLIHTVLPQSRK